MSVPAFTKSLSFLGNLPVAEFLQRYWQKKPLLIRNAFPNFQPVISRVELFLLAAQEDVESRLVGYLQKRWRLQHGPIGIVPAAPKNWTLLVQGVNLHHEKAAALLNQFRFIPDARLDDLMVSYAVDKGGVGPHVDSYDVFLLQAEGQRCWQIGAQADREFIPNSPLKILKKFQPEQEWLLDPGDMLYLPPQYAHNGIAKGECMTYSIGFRAPTWQELMTGFLHSMIDHLELPDCYRDENLQASRHPANISNAMLDCVEEGFQDIRWNRNDVLLFLGEYLSEPKSSTVFHSPQPKKSSKQWLSMAFKKGIQLDRKTRMLYHRDKIFINGESIRATQPDLKNLILLANQRGLTSLQLSRCSVELQGALHDWCLAGWVEIAATL